MKRHRGLVALFILTAAALAGILAARPLYNLYRDVSFSWVERTEAEKEVKAYAESQGISYGEYPQYLIDLYERNPETRETVLNYPFREDTEIDLGGYSRDTVPLFLQYDPMWAYESYGSSVVAVTGCGPACLAMAGYYLTGDESMNPAQVAKFAQQEGYYVTGYGSSWELISQGAGKLGLAAQELPLVKKKLITALESGSPVILSLGPGDFTTEGHYVVLTGWDGEAFQVNDPNSLANSQASWTYEALERQIRNIWAISLAEAQ